MASHWALASLSWLISFFLKLISHIPWLASSCNNQISNPTTASASHSGASLTRCLAVDDSMSIIVDVSLPTDDGASCPSNACGTGSTTTAGSSQAKMLDLSRPSLVHPIEKLFQRQKMGKAVLEFAVSMTTGLLISQLQGLTHLQANVIVLALSLGFATLWNGMLLHGICPRVASALEYIGMGIILVAFFGLVSLFLPPTLVWASWLCCGLSGLPFFLRLVLLRADEVASSAERLDQGIV